MTKTYNISELLKQKLSDGRTRQSKNDESQITSAKFAKAIGVDRVTVSFWLNGVATPSLPNYLKILDYFELTDKDFKNIKQ